MFKKVVIFAAVAAIALPVSVASEAAPKPKKDKRSQMTAEQKKDLRRRAREWCIKNYARGNAAEIVRIDIQSDGRVRCWYRG
jgi:hypothetical protein